MNTPGGNDIQDDDQQTGSLSKPAAQDWKTLLRTADTAQQVEAIAQALMQNARMEDPRDIAERVEHFEYLKKLGEALERYAHDILSLQEPLAQLEIMMNDLCNIPFVDERHVSVKNPHAHYFDGLTSDIFRPIMHLQAVLIAADRFCGVSEFFRQRVRKNDINMRDRKEYEMLKTHVDGFLEVIERTQKIIREFPHWCREITDVTQARQKLLAMTYVDPPPDGAPHEPVPLYQNNVELTAFFHHVVSQIPALKNEHGKKKRGAADIDAYDFMSFERYLLAHADGALMMNLTTDCFYQTVADAMERLHALYMDINEDYKKYDIVSMQKIDPHRGKHVYHDILQKGAEAAPGSGNDMFEYFDAPAMAAALRKIHPVLPAKSANGTKHENERQKAYLALFARLDQIFDELITHQEQEQSEELPEKKIEEYIVELANMKHESLESPIRSRNSRLQKDRLEGNFAYEVIKQEFGQISLSQVPTHSAKLEDVFGASWKQVRENLEQLLEDHELGFVYSAMSARGKANNNMLIVGPYGCGKNMFLRALTSDPRTVGVSMTTGRIMTPWVGQPESNVRALFEMAHDVHIKHDKPAVIAWDEMDSLFDGGSENLRSNIHTGMQKELQSVLDGDKIFDGVNLIALTNEPQKIPVALYRRFARVEIIKALSGNERVQLLQHMLAGIPKEENFEKFADWDELIKMTEYASGDLLGKIHDQAYAQFVRLYKEKNRSGLKNVNKDAKETIMQGASLTAADRLAIFEKHAPDIRLTAAMFHASMHAVLAQPDVQHAMAQQERFYENVDRLMQQAFSDAL